MNLGSFAVWNINNPAVRINALLQPSIKDGRVGGGAWCGSEDVLGGELLAGWLLLPQALCPEVLPYGSQGQLHRFPHRLWWHLGLVPCSLGKCRHEKELNVFGNQTKIDYDTFQAELTTCLLFNLRPCCPFICQARWFLVCLCVLRYLGQAVTADWLPLAERSPCFSHHIYSSSSSGGSTHPPSSIN